MKLRKGVLIIAVMTLRTPVGAQQAAPNEVCVTVIDAIDQHPVAGARVSQAGTASSTAPVRTTDANGQGCLPGRDSTRVQVDAVGYQPVDGAPATVSATRVLLQQFADGAIRPAWGARQILAGLAQALRRPEISRDSLMVSALDGVLRRAIATQMQTTVTRDSSGLLVLGYVDLSTESAHYGDLRMWFNQRETIVLGITTTRCAAACERELDVAISWSFRSAGGWMPEFIARKENGGEVIRIALDARAVETSGVGAAGLTDSAALPRTANVSGKIRSDRGAALAGIEVYSADGSAFTVTNDRGEYRLTVTIPPGGALLSTRRLGWAPEFHKVSKNDGASVQWNPTLRTTTVLARQLVRAAGVPDALRSPRYDDFLMRRARGVGQFFMAEEIWSAVSLGDLLFRARGIRPFFKEGNHMSSIYVPACPKGAAAVGVFVNGIDQTGRLPTGAPEEPYGGSPSDAVNVLTQYVNAAIVGMEIYIGRTQLPPEFGDPRYCAVIALWTR